MSLLIKSLSDLKQSIALMESRPGFCIFAEEAVEETDHGHTNGFYSVGRS